MKRSISLLLAVPLMLTGCGGKTIGDQSNPQLPPDSTPSTSTFAPNAASMPESASSPRRTFNASERAPSRPQLFDRMGNPKRAMRSAATKAAVVTCDVAQFSSRSGYSLVQYIQDSGATCVNELFVGNGTTYATFTRSKMSDVASYTASFASSYTGVDTNNLEALYLFLRAGYYVGFYFSANLDWQITDASLKASMRQAIDAFVNNSHFYDNSDAHGAPLREALTLIDSSDNQASYLNVVKSWLTRWNQTYSTSWYMRSAVNEIFTILFRGHQQADFKAAVQNDSTLIYNLGSFVDQRWMINTDSEFMMSNAARELARFIQYKTAPIYSIVQSKVKSILASYTLTDTPYMAVADVVNYYDNCANYGTCTFRTDLEARILTIKHTCSSTIQIRAQSMTTSELADSCTILQAEETYFHQKLATKNQPVAGDQNSFLDVVIFDSSADYGKYAGPIFQIDTNNGGMYMEGDPAVPGNQAHFYCYEAEWVRPAFEVWNLKHEYVHYLDGRFNMKGGFNDYLTAKTIWWIEGLGEYVSHQDYYDYAIQLGRTKAYRLSQVFENTYSSGQDLVYRWGYLAARFMFEKHPADVNTVLGYFRSGNYTGYASWLSGIQYNYDNEFTTWLDTVQSIPDTNPTNKSPIAVVNGPYTGNVNTAIAFSSAGSTDPDGTITSYAWSFGDGTTSTQANPSKSYTTAGTYTVTLVVTDNLGAPSVVAQTTATIGGVNPTNKIPIAVVNGPYTGSVNSAIAFSSAGSYDPDGTIASYAWSFGDGTTSTQANPSKSYSTAGTYTVTLVVTDNLKGTSIAAKTTATVSGGGGVDACATSAPVEYVELKSGASVCVAPSATTSIAYFYIYIQPGNTQLTATLSGGTGDANLYGSSSYWADSYSYEVSSAKAGTNNESFTTSLRTSGWYFVSVETAKAHSGATLTVTVR